MSICGEAARTPTGRSLSIGGQSEAAFALMVLKELAPFAQRRIGQMKIH
jgi:hypothetical protein